ncbi:MAG: EF-hand domain-containing protein [Candidatus Hydrogenedentes bacterium]|nr:EF-hand domain-containing protein [Candidatus Hydrogenedentota bacterium]
MNRVNILVCSIGALLVLAVLGSGSWAVVPEPCPLPNEVNVYLDLLWPYLDSNRDGGLSVTELQLIIPSQYWTYISLLFSYADTNADGNIDRNEIQPIVALVNSYYPNGFVSLIDKNGDGLIQYEEVAGYVDRQTFDMLDKNNNGVIDCGDLVEEPPIDLEGEVTIEGEYVPPETDPCDWVELALQEFDNLDQNGDGLLSREELNFPIIMIYPPPVDFDVLFDAFDLDDNGAVSKEELDAWAQMCGVSGGGDNGECPLPADARSVFELLLPLVDLNDDGKLSKDEVRAIYPDIDSLLAQYQLSLDMVYLIVDTNRDGGVSVDELIAVLYVLAPQIGVNPDNLLAEIDTNGDLMLSYDEVAQYVTPEQFSYVDINGNGLIDCNDLNVIVNPPIEGEFPPEWLDPCQIGPIILENFSMVDVNADGKLTIEDINNILTVVLPIPVDPEFIQSLFSIFDIDGDSAITREEIQTILDAVCNIVIEGEPVPIEGEFEIPTDPCVIAPFVLQYFNYLDRDGDGKITLEEVLGIVVIMGQMPAVYPLPFPIDPALIEEIFNDLDLNSDGAITREELETTIQNCAGGPVEGEPSVEGEIEILPIWDPCQLVGYALRFFDQIDTDGDGKISAGDLIIILGTYYPSVVGYENVLQNIFSMFDLNSDEYITREEIQMIADKCSQVVPSAGEEGEDIPIEEGESQPQGNPHSGDFDRDWKFSLAEILRVIQIFNNGGYGCDEGTEDGYGPGLGKHRNCPPHSADFRIIDWKIDLAELLRVVQLYNAKKYVTRQGTEDGYAPVL